MLGILKEFGPAGAIGLLIGLILLGIIGPRTSGGAVLIMMMPVILAVAMWSVIRSLGNRQKK
jgi:ABC-type Co2+ transport system permease subunit